MGGTKETDKRAVQNTKQINKNRPHIKKHTWKQGEILIIVVGAENLEKKKRQKHATHLNPYTSRK